MADGELIAASVVSSAIILLITIIFLCWKCQRIMKGRKKLSNSEKQMIKFKYKAVPTNSDTETQQLCKGLVDVRKAARQPFLRHNSAKASLGNGLAMANRPDLTQSNGLAMENRPDHTQSNDSPVERESVRPKSFLKKSFSGDFHNLGTSSPVFPHKPRPFFSKSRSLITKRNLSVSDSSPNCLSLVDAVIYESYAGHRASSDPYSTVSHMFPEISFKLEHNVKESKLIVTILQVTNIPEKSAGTKYYVKLYLRPAASELKLKSHLRGSLSPVYNECFIFDKIDSIALGCSHLLLLLYTAKGKLLGETFKVLAAVSWESQQQHQFKEPLHRMARHRKASTDEKLLLSYLGKALITVHFDTKTKTLTIHVAKAKSLAKTESFKVNTEYYAIVSLKKLHSGEQLIRRMTNVVKDTLPTWDETFDFYFLSDSLDDHYIEIDILEKKKYMHDITIGCIGLGNGSSSDTDRVWNTALTSGLPTCQWLDILPAIRYRNSLF